MESRLPKPKIILKKAISTVDMNVKSNNNKLRRDDNTSASTSTISTKSINENKLVPKQTLVRSKTLSTITRPTNVTAVKRTATAVTYGEVKRPFVKPVAKTIVNKSSNNALVTNNRGNKVVQNNTDNKTDKIKRWDLRGRLAQTSDKLSVATQKHKDIESKYTALQELVNNLQASETLYRTKAQELEVSNGTLTSKLQCLTEETSIMRERHESLTQRLKEAEESCKSLSYTLNDIQGKYKAQEILVLEQTKELTTLKSDLESQTKINEELETLSHNMDKERRLLHNTIQELKGNIRVFCRVRPRTPQEIEQMKGMCSINFIDDCTIEINKLDGLDAINNCSGKSKGVKQEFSFDKVFTPNASQQEIFEELSLLVQSALEGYNVCVFAYGQTGSGKTYTMEGEYGLHTEGMIPRTVRHIFKEMKQFELLGWNYRIEASFLEIYNEHIIDLLDCQPKTHEIRMVNSKGQDLYVSNLQIKEIHSPEELHECLYTAQQNRAVAATQANERSSRSHSVAQIRLIGTHSTKQEISIGNLNLVDLAGSERLKSEEAARNAETKNINKSLANLGNVILALLKKQEHIPYRNSKLTHLLMPSLGGNSKTLMLLNISPLNECYNETLNSLRFASSVNSCKTGNIKRSRMVLQNITN
ncbi:protein claret segregational [Linepithema humile]|uniref:protein claret segregational n=1 Tax=Linepithema humile TaxID=83485 RepID=UPI0006232F8F|nr:PREDICTED: protein claret segregational [Linepithema humile]XP_012221119.1 PREDICTED: protein claret segregational [Linepithema humile]